MRGRHRGRRGGAPRAAPATAGMARAAPPRRRPGARAAGAAAAWPGWRSLAGTLGGAGGRSKRRARSIKINMSNNKVLTLEEVSKHNTKDDCWLIIGGKVYNVTKFLEDHPGGDDVLLSSTAKDATDDFEDVGHSTTARAMMDEYYVGDIDATTIPTKVKYTPPKQPHYNQDKTPEFIIKILQFLVPLAILGLAVAVRIYTKSESA